MLFGLFVTHLISGVLHYAWAADLPHEIRPSFVQINNTDGAVIHHEKTLPIDSFEKVNLDGVKKSETTEVEGSATTSSTINAAEEKAATSTGTSSTRPETNPQEIGNIANSGGSISEPFVQIIKLPPNGIFSKMGLREGDHVKMINGEPVHSIEKVKEFYHQLLLRGTGSLKIEVERNGKPTHLNYKVN